MKKKQTLLAAAVVLLVLAAAFWYGGDAPGLQGWSPSAGSAQASTSAQSDASASSQGTASSTPADEASPAAPEGSQSGPQEGEDTAQTPEAPQAPETPEEQAPSGQSGSVQPSQPEPEAPPASSQTQPEAPSSSQDTPPEEQDTACRISIVCSTVLDHLDWLAEGKADILPAGGVLLAECAVEPQEGETAFSLLQRVTREQGIQMEASFTPGTGSAYVEGIGNLYEFDCGQRSGWLYFVNGISPGYSSSEYTLKPGDRVEWVYTCDMGQDVGATVAGG